MHKGRTKRDASTSWSGLQGTAAFNKAFPTEAARKEYEDRLNKIKFEQDQKDKDKKPADKSNDDSDKDNKKK